MSLKYHEYDNSESFKFEIVRRFNLVWDRVLWNFLKECFDVYIPTWECFEISDKLVEYINDPKNFNDEKVKDHILSCGYCWARLIKKTYYGESDVSNM